MAGIAGVGFLQSRPHPWTVMSDTHELSEQDLATLVDRFYEQVRVDPELGPVFNAAIDDWPEHKRRLTAFWSSVVLGTKS